ncbi:MAG TPA: DUF1330 domain-containing protein [Blastocatellia bacterium]|nr:DUF1330 domain-containing protein [Blastocatellia bacterium]
MTTNRKLVLGVLAGIVIGIAATTVIHAGQNKPAPGYIVAELDAITGDPANLKQYGAKVEETLAPFKHRFIIHSGNPTTLEGQSPMAIVVVEFDSVQQARAWYESPAYDAIKPLRQSSTKGRVFIAEGVAPK